MGMGTDAEGASQVCREESEMTDEELKAYIDDAVQNAVAKQNPQKEFTPRLLSPTHTKWFRDENGNANRSKMGKAFHGDGVRAYQIWDRVRPICTAICGKAYVSQVSIDDADFINEVADRICQLIYDSKIEFDKRKEERV